MSNSLYTRPQTILEEYQDFVQSTKAGNLTYEENLMLGGLGLTGEAGEVADLIKKKVFHKHEISRSEFIKEIGDVLWYLTFLCNSMSIELDEVIEANKNKLNVRYLNGFSPEASVARVDQKPKHKNDSYDVLCSIINETTKNLKF